MSRFASAFAVDCQTSSVEQGRRHCPLWLRKETRFVGESCRKKGHHWLRRKARGKERVKESPSSNVNELPNSRESIVKIFTTTQANVRPSFETQWNASAEVATLMETNAARSE